MDVVKEHMKLVGVREEDSLRPVKGKEEMQVRKISIIQLMITKFCCRVSVLLSQCCGTLSQIYDLLAHINGTELHQNLVFSLTSILLDEQQLNMPALRTVKKVKDCYIHFSDFINLIYPELKVP